MGNSLEQYITGWKPSALVETDVLTSEVSGWLADLLAADRVAPPGVLPPSWHWVYFTDWPHYEGLAADGHPHAGHFQPPIPERRRMWAGGSITSHGDLILDEEVERTGTVLSAVPKSGRSGEMALISVQYEFRQRGELRLTEVQNHVYRSGADDAPARTWPPRPQTPVETDAGWRHDIATDEIRLFRMSAITGNSHRIHYDRRYATEVEGYPDLVVHGPLLAQHLATLALRHDPSLRLEQFDYRVQAPVFVGDAVSAIGRPNGDSAELQVISAPDRVHVAATATYHRSS
ncbi:MaoC/PaaZ C-terminal domain-containing protein [Cumulibacter soli]|uniref:MaoC/PaaZ C-terminal domain-containing protein n=1 Tax=Cumulibacter soli TaxID=2546344 RepID=UPI0010689849|nr:MaoC/PaaZ C-terminal domain-containing protein [Cumulibacter soli]